MPHTAATRPEPLWPVVTVGLFRRDRDQVGEDARPVPSATSCQVPENLGPGLLVTLVFTRKPASPVPSLQCAPDMHPASKVC